MSDFTIKDATAVDLGPPFTDPAAAFIAWPRPYRSYATHGGFNAELARIARSKYLQYPGHKQELKVQTTTLQPFSKPGEKGNEDRHIVQFWEFPSGTWTFAAVFDGHAGEETAAYAVDKLPQTVHEGLQAALLSRTFTPKDISDALKSSVELFDKSLTDDLLAILPPNLEDLSEEDAENIANDEKNGQVILRCMRGSTALVALLDPGKQNLWVANLGDCQALLAKSGDNGVEAKILTSPHNGRSEAEQQRIRLEHPGEEEAIFKDRVLGALAVTRGSINVLFSSPSISLLTVDIRSPWGPCIQASRYRHDQDISEANAGLPRAREEFILRNITPPYLSSTPDVVHRKLDTGDQKLILCSDGLTDLYAEREVNEEEATQRIAKIASQKGEGDELEGLEGNRALHIVKDALGNGHYLDSQSAFLTIDFDFPHLDDITVIVLEW